MTGGPLPPLDPDLGALKPRILVCAPSNAAIDELLERILRDGFRAREGNSYRPSVCRVGSDEALNEGVRQVGLHLCAVRDGLRGDEGNSYRPSVCRVGSDEALNEGVHQVSALPTGCLPPCPAPCLYPRCTVAARAACLTAKHALQLPPQAVNMHIFFPQVWAEEMAGRLLALLPEQWAAEMRNAELTLSAAGARIFGGQRNLMRVCMSVHVVCCLF